VSHVSHSQFEDYISCGEKYRLKRVAQATQEVSLNAAAGTAFHHWSEDYDRGSLLEGWTEPELPAAHWPDYLESAVAEKELQSGTTRDTWRISGRVSKRTPDKESYGHWRDQLGPELIDSYVKWRQTAGYKLAVDLVPDEFDTDVGLEYCVSFRLGNTTVRGFVDRIMVDELGNYGVVDIKAGARKQVSAQKQTYAVGCRKRSIPITWTATYYARKGALTKPQFDIWDEGRLSYLYEQMQAAKDAGFYLPNPGEHCSWCSVRDFCQFKIVE
jgi:hypothetical protein